MSIDVTLQRVVPRRLAAVRREVRVGCVGTACRPALDLVWSFLRAQPGLHAGGHNVFLYHHPAARGAPMTIDFGVEVTRTFDARGEVGPAATPAGEAAVAVHVGPYERLADTHDAIHAWAKQNRRIFAGQSWEIYGDWADDPAKLETTVVYLLA